MLPADTVPPQLVARHAAERPDAPFGALHVPRFVDVVDELPKTPTRKIRKVEPRAAGISPSTWDREFRSDAALMA